MDKDIRRSVLAGTLWYPGNPKILWKDIENFLRNVPDEEIEGKIAGLIVPHAGYMYSGQVAAYAYKIIRGEPFEAVIVIGPSHRTFFHGISLYNKGGYETPLGVVPVDVALANNIMAQSKMLTDIAAPHVQEHSIEIQLPFLQVSLGEFHFVPVIMGEQDRRACETLAESIIKGVGPRRALIVGSSDLSHFHTYEKAIRLDSRALKHIEEMDDKGLIQDLEDNVCEACGGGPAAVVMMVSKKMGAKKAKILKYANSGDVTGEKKSVVGYASVVFYQ